MGFYLPLHNQELRPCNFTFLQERNRNQKATKNQVCIREGYGLCL